MFKLNKVKTFIFNFNSHNLPNKLHHNAGHKKDVLSDHTQTKYFFQV